MHLVGVHLGAQCGIDLLVAADGALAFKFGRDDGGIPVAAVAFEFEVLAAQAGGYQGLELVCCLGV
jgi:hypothetical protein